MMDYPFFRRTESWRQHRRSHTNTTPSYQTSPAASHSRNRSCWCCYRPFSSLEAHQQRLSFLAMPSPRGGSSATPSPKPGWYPPLLRRFAHRRAFDRTLCLPHGWDRERQRRCSQEREGALLHTATTTGRKNKNNTHQSVRCSVFPDSLAGKML